MKRHSPSLLSALAALLLMLPAGYAWADDGAPEGQDDDDGPSAPSDDDEAPDDEEDEPEASTNSEEERRPTPQAERNVRRDMGDRTGAARGRAGSRRPGATVRPDAPLPPRAPPPLPDFML